MTKLGFHEKAFVEQGQETGPWGSWFEKLKEWDPKGAETLLRVGMNPWTSGVLPLKEMELISLALNCACTNLDEAAPVGTSAARWMRVRLGRRF